MNPLWGEILTAICWIFKPGPLWQYQIGIEHGRNVTGLISMKDVALGFLAMKADFRCLVCEVDCRPVSQAISGTGW